MGRGGSLFLFLDHCVPDSVAEVLKKYGHTIRFLREWLPTDSPDVLVATVSENEGSILVSIDGDFRKIAPRIPQGARQRFRKLSHIRLECPEPQAARRLEQAMSFIEAEAALALQRADKRMILSISTNVMRTYR
jgi:predicted nuclease of predicted toxin-antitoxin system